MTKNNRYAHSRVYKLTDEKYYYFGSTCMSLHKRFYDHKSVAKKDCNRKIYTIFTHERFINNEIKIVLVEEFNLESKEQLLKEEDRHIKMNIDDPFCLNSQHAILNLEKCQEYNKNYKTIYYENNKENLKLIKKEYYENNKEKLKKKNSKRYVCECGDELTINHKLRHEKTKKHNIYINFKQKSNCDKTIDKRIYQKTECICGSIYNKDQKLKHQRTKKHINFINQQQ